MATKTAKKSGEGSKGHGRGGNGPGTSKVPPPSWVQDQTRRDIKRKRRSISRPSSSNHTQTPEPPVQKRRPTKASTSTESASANKRELMASHYERFTIWILEPDAPDVHLRDRDIEDWERYVQCLFFPGTFPAGLPESLIDETRKAFVSYCFEQKLTEKILPGQKCAWYNTLWNVLEEEAYQARIKSRIAANQARQAVIDHAIGRLKKDRSLTAEEKRLGVKYVKDLFTGSSEPLTLLSEPKLDQIRYSVVWGIRSNQLPPNTLWFQSSSWFMQAWTEVGIALLRRNQRAS